MIISQKKVVTNQPLSNQPGVRKKMLFLPVEPIFQLYFLRKYASEDNNLHNTHCCLILLHFLSLQKLAQNSGMGWQKIAGKTATATAKFFPQRLIKTNDQIKSKLKIKSKLTSAGKPRNWQHCRLR